MSKRKHHRSTKKNNNMLIGIVLIIAVVGLLYYYGTNQTSTGQSTIQNLFSGTNTGATFIDPTYTTSGGGTITLYGTIGSSYRIKNVTINWGWNNFTGINLPTGFRKNTFNKQPNII